MKERNKEFVCLYIYIYIYRLPDKDNFYNTPQVHPSAVIMQVGRFFKHQEIRIQRRGSRSVVRVAITIVNTIAIVTTATAIPFQQHFQHGNSNQLN